MHQWNESKSDEREENTHVKEVKLGGPGPCKQPSRHCRNSSFHFKHVINLQNKNRIAAAGIPLFLSLHRVTTLLLISTWQPPASAALRILKLQQSPGSRSGFMKIPHASWSPYAAFKHTTSSSYFRVRMLQWDFTTLRTWSRQQTNWWKGKKKMYIARVITRI